LIKEYGKEFLRDYGWASVVLGKTIFGLKGMEKHVGLEQYRPIRNMSNQLIHSGARSMSVSLGSDTLEMLLSGPSDAGFRDPGQHLAMSLNIVTLNLLAVYPTYLALFLKKILNKWILEIQSQFKEAQEEHERIVRAKRAGDS